MKYSKLIVWTSIIALWFLFTIGQLSPNYIGNAYVPNPYFVIIKLIEILKEGYYGLSLFNHIGSSFYRLFMAIMLAIVTAVPLGLLCGYYKKLEVFVSEIVNFLRPLPPLAYYTLIVLLVKSIDNEPKIILLFIAAFCPLYIACVMAVKQVKQDHILSAKTLGANNLQIFKNVVLPSSLPNIFTGLRTGVGVAYTTLVTAEIFAAESGLGFLIFYAYDVKHDYASVFIGIIILGVSALLLDTLLKSLENKLVFWKGLA